MKAYEKIGWLDHVQDIETGEVIQDGTPVSQVNMNHMDEGIFTNREAFILHEAQIADAQKEIEGCDAEQHGQQCLSHQLQHRDLGRDHVRDLRLCGAKNLCIRSLAAARKQAASSGACSWSWPRYARSAAGCRMAC